VTAAEIEARVLGHLRAHARKPVEPTAETDILADTGMDSVAVMDFVLELEDEFDITIPLSRLAEVRTAGDVVRAIRAIVQEGAATAPVSGRVEETG